MTNGIPWLRSLKNYLKRNDSSLTIVGKSASTAFCLTIIIKSMFVGAEHFIKAARALLRCLLRLTCVPIPFEVPNPINPVPGRVMTTKHLECFLRPSLYRDWNCRCVIALILFNCIEVLEIKSKPRAEFSSCNRESFRTRIVNRRPCRRRSVFHHSVVFQLFFDHPI